jgi:hypothetical protein
MLVARCNAVRYDRYGCPRCVNRIALLFADHLALLVLSPGVLSRGPVSLALFLFVALLIPFVVLLLEMDDRGLCLLMFSFCYENGGREKISIVFIQENLILISFLVKFHG